MTKAQGFTLIELMVSVTIVALLASVAVPLAQLGVQRSKERELRFALREIRTALDEYHEAAFQGRVYRSADSSGYPPSLEVLVDGVADLKDPNGRKIFFMRRLPRDPFHSDSSVPAAKTWRLRSYESDAANPREGKDVYDVYSSAQEIGLNGIPYREW